MNEYEHSEEEGSVFPAVELGKPLSMTGLYRASSTPAGRVTQTVRFIEAANGLVGIGWSQKPSSLA